jgi:hypothetical protein
MKPSRVVSFRAGAPRQTTSSTATKPAGTGTVDVTNTSLTKILVDSQGRTRGARGSVLCGSSEANVTRRRRPAAKPMDSRRRTHRPSNPTRPSK